MLYTSGFVDDVMFSHDNEPNMDKGSKSATQRIIHRDWPAAPLNRAAGAKSAIVDCLIKTKFHYASWFEAGRRQVRSQTPLRYLVRSWFEAGRRQV